MFAPPKRNKERDVPLPDRVAHILKQHMEAFPPIDVTLPWLRSDGPPTTKQLMFTRLDGTGAVRRTDFNTRAWKPALVAAGVIPEPKASERHQAAREHGMHALRRFYASVLLDAGENIKALNRYLGHHDPGFTLRVYTHLMPSSDARTRKAVDGLYESTDPAPDGPETAQGQ
ncbi:tyrosine-type recombinase/integrase [Streptomyces hirsutus]|uniref:tyrosine-type recombinase/integrase n=1 Tax=Streptomyces hirsutus TaxID=35620 RepID=UPI00363ED254